MPEQQLYRPQIRPMIEQMSGESVPQGMRRQRFADTRLQGIAFDQIPESLPGHGLAPLRYEQIGTGTVSQPEGTRELHILAQ